MAGFKYQGNILLSISFKLYGEKQFFKAVVIRNTMVCGGSVVDYVSSSSEE